MNGYETYEQMVKETDELIRRVMLHNEIGTILVCSFLIAVICFMGWLAWSDHKAKKRQLEAQREAEQEWLNTRTAMGAEMQYDGNNTYYRMH